MVLVGDITVYNLKNSRKSTEFNELAEYYIIRVTLPPTRVTPESSSSIDAVWNHNGQRCKINVKVNMKIIYSTSLELGELVKIQRTLEARILG